MATCCRRATSARPPCGSHRATPANGVIGAAREDAPTRLVADAVKMLQHAADGRCVVKRYRVCHPSPVAPAPVRCQRVADRASDPGRRRHNAGTDRQSSECPRCADCAWWRLVSEHGQEPAGPHVAHRVPDRTTAARPRPRGSGPPHAPAPIGCQCPPGNFFCSRCAFVSSPPAIDYRCTRVGGRQFVFLKYDGPARDILPPDGISS